MYLDGHGIRTRGPRGERVVDDTFLLLLHTGEYDADVVLPGPPWAQRWDVEIDTREEDGGGGGGHTGGSTLRLLPRCALLLRAVL
jgi:glycogen operon protein